ncbi:long-chain fatty acid--CoA ligase [Alloscardovia macacae]|uniref:Acyl-CoA synthetase n=1 Tax=Alloscardovia macacae TaxID=1160091 RepID=A0A1Y2T0C3_9BIFI|nr:AMP-dependent synthetase/ligase [Alloscardovia macacae]OTA25612.1 long-chain fatty acid--CoA ligase [Alloscardovia macacae]OTA28198.1 long-chain fatty acid--CoA ligase [Alloscardovia macacae]
MRKEYTRAVTTPIDADANVFSILQNRVQRAAHEPLIEYKAADGSWTGYTAEEFQTVVIGLAKGLMARGVQPGDAVAVMSRTRWEWTALDLAIMSIGAVTVPIYETNSALQVKTIANDSQVRIIVAENDAQREKIDAVRNDMPTVTDVFILDNDSTDVTIMQTLTEYGKAVEDADFWAREQAVRGADLATIVYTSGSTGTPKGIELSHANFVYAAYSGIQSMTDICYRPGGARLLLFLPLAHVFARYMQFFCIGSDTVLGLSSNLKTIIPDFQSFKPTFILAVPRIFEKVYNAASQKAGGGYVGRLFNRAANLAREWSHAQQEGRALSLAKRLQYALYQRVIYKTILGVFGGHVEYAVSGGAPLDSSIAHFFNGVGLPLLEGYGMTETCAPVCVNPTKGYKIGTIGMPLEGMTFGVADDGELCVKSESVCLGYHNHPEIDATQLVDGWLHTGDLGDIDSDGFIRITGRKKDLIITAGGKNVSPSMLESSVATSPVVSQCVVIGDKKPFIAALIALDLADTNAWLASQGAAEVASLEAAAVNPIVAAEVERAVDKANLQVSRAESIRKYKILADTFTEENGMLTASLKTKRAVIIQHYQDVVEKEIYTPRK